MAEKTLYIHIGTPKTGTTAIQHFLRMNRDVFENNGWMIYTAQDDNHPERNLRFLTTYLNVFGKIELINKGLLPKAPFKQKKILTEWYTGFLKTLKNSTYDKIMLSEEMLWWAVCDKEKMLILFDDIKKYFKVKFIVYLRRQDYYLMSIYQQSLKAGGGGGLNCADWITEKDNLQASLYSHYAEHLKWLSELVEKKNIIIRIYEKEQFINQSIFDDFLSTVTLKITDKFKIPQKNINKGLSAFAVELGRCFSKHNHTKSSFMRFIARYKIPELFNEIDKQHNLIPPALRCKLLAKYDAENKYIAENFMHRKDGRLFHEPLPSTDTPWTPYKLSIDDTVSLFLKIADQQDKKILSLEKIIEQQQHKQQIFKIIYQKLPYFLQYPIRKIWRLKKILTANIFGGTE